MGRETLGKVFIATIMILLIAQLEWIVTLYVFYCWSFFALQTKLWGCDVIPVEQPYILECVEEGEAEKKDTPVLPVATTSTKSSNSSEPATLMDLLMSGSAYDDVETDVEEENAETRANKEVGGFIVCLCRLCPGICAMPYNYVVWYVPFVLFGSES